MNKLNRKLLLIKSLLGEIESECKFALVLHKDSQTNQINPDMREGKSIKFEGRFPCDENGKPIMKWIGIKATNVEKISCSCEKSQQGDLSFEISPKTVIHVLNFYNNDDDIADEWYSRHSRS